MQRSLGSTITDLWTRITSTTRVGRELGSLVGVLFQQRVVSLITQLLLDLAPLCIGTVLVLEFGERLSPEGFAPGSCSRGCVISANQPCCLISAGSLILLAALQLIVCVAGFLAALRAPRGEALRRASVMNAGFMIMLAIAVLTFGTSLVFALISAGASIFTSFIGYRAALRVKAHRRSRPSPPA